MSLLACLRGKEEKSCLAFFHGFDDTLCVTLVDAATQKEIKMIMYDGRRLKRFIRDIPKIYGKKLKAVILQFDGFHGHEFKNYLELQNAFRTKLTALNIPHYFAAFIQFIYGSIIMTGNIESNIGEEIIISRVVSSRMGFLKFEYTEAGYESRCIMSVLETSDRNAAVQKITELCGSYSKVLIEYSANCDILKTLRKILKFDNLIFIETELTKFIVETSKWMFDKSYKKLFTVPIAEGNYFVMNSAAEELLTIHHNDSLPAMETCVIPKSVGVVLECDNKEAYIVHKMEQKCHRNKITLSVDGEGFSSFLVEPIMLPEIESFTSNLNSKLESKIPVIGFCDNFSVICVYKDDVNEYKFINGWNGIYGTELVISFYSKKLLFGEEALSSSKSMISYNFEENGKPFTFQEPKKPIYGSTKEKPFKSENESDQHEPGSLVYDLINIMSMPVDDFKVEDLWGFEITKDDDHPVLLEFMNHEKELKQASPAFLMALLLKEHIKVIKTEIGEKPEKLGFCILDENYGDQEKERIKDGLKEACELLKIGFEFIDV